MKYIRYIPDIPPNGEKIFVSHIPSRRLIYRIHSTIPWYRPKKLDIWLHKYLLSHVHYHCIYIFIYHDYLCYLKSIIKCFKLYIFLGVFKDKTVAQQCKTKAIFLCLKQVFPQIVFLYYKKKLVCIWVYITKENGL